MAEPGGAAAQETTAFDAVGGELGLRRLVERFYDLMELQQASAGIRQLHPSELQGSRDKLFWYLCGWLGGPNHYIERFGHPRLRARHMPFVIGIAERDQWMACMSSAMVDIGLPTELTELLTKQFFATADWMRNSPG